MNTIIFPQPTSGPAAATVIRWHRQPADSFVAGDALVELEAEAELIVVEAAQSGTLTEILAEPGRTVQVGAPLARYLAGGSPEPAARRSAAERNEIQEQAEKGIGTVVPILMPQAGNTMEEGTIVSWRVKEGDTVAVGQVICEIETDKATIDFESPAAGRVARLVAEVGQPVPVKQPIALLAENDVDVDAYLAAGKRGGTANAVDPSTSARVVEREPIAATTTTTPNSRRVKASPAARNLASRHGVDVARIRAGSGPGGRILSTDVAHSLHAGGAQEAQREGLDAAAGRRRTPLSKMRRAIGRNLQASKQTIPHFYVRRSIDADPLLAFHAARTAATSATLNDAIVLAVGRAIGEFPAVRSQIDGDDLVEFRHANVGIAVAVEEGLVVPVVLAVDTLSLAELAAQTKRIIDSARQGRLENTGQGNFTISNLGMYGVDEFSAIINPPESGILAVSAIREEAVVEHGAIRAGRTMTMTLSADHRLVDGVTAAKFLARLKEILEHPEQELA